MVFLCRLMIICAKYVTEVTQKRACCFAMAVIHLTIHFASFHLYLRFHLVTGDVPAALPRYVRYIDTFARTVVS